MIIMITSMHRAYAVFIIQAMAGAITTLGTPTAIGITTTLTVLAPVYTWATVFGQTATCHGATETLGDITHGGIRQCGAMDTEATAMAAWHGAALGCLTTLTAWATHFC